MKYHKMIHQYQKLANILTPFKFNKYMNFIVGLHKNVLHFNHYSKNIVKEL